MFSQAHYSMRNVGIKSALTFFLGLGIGFAIYAILSCRWFEFGGAFRDTEKGNLFVSDSNNATAATSVGLFRYQASFDHNNESFSSSISNGQCVQYDPVFSDNSWIFAAQLLIMIGPLLALFSWIEAALDVNRNTTLYLIDAATFVQVASVILSMSRCGQFGNCSLLLGAFANIASAACFFISLIVALVGLESSTDDGPEKTVTNTDVESLEHDPRLQEEEDWTISYGTPAPVIDNEEYNDHQESNQEVSETKDKKESDESDLGTKDPIIQRPVKDNVFIVRDMKSKLLARQAKMENEKDVGDSILAVIESEDVGSGVLDP